MKKSVAMRWVKALRSGKYKQGHDRLGNADQGYCCLGLLCHITGTSFNAEDKELTDAQRETLGIATPCARIEGYGGRTTNLAALNDGSLAVEFIPSLGVEYRGQTPERPRSFKQIARIIEQHWEKL
jgi:hypothetical protein